GHAGNVRLGGVDLRRDPAWLHVNVLSRRRRSLAILTAVLAVDRRRGRRIRLRLPGSGWLGPPGPGWPLEDAVRRQPRYSGDRRTGWGGRPPDQADRPRVPVRGGADLPGTEPGGTGRRCSGPA